MAPSAKVAGVVAYESASDDDSDAGAPETVTRSQSVAETKRKAAALQAAGAEQKRRRKAKNKERDEALKRRAAEMRGEADEEEGVKGKRKGKFAEEEDLEGEPEGAKSALEERMERAMKEAALEMEDGDNAFEEDGDDGDEELGGSGDEDIEEDGEEEDGWGGFEEDVDMGSEPSSEEDEDISSRSNSNKLQAKAKGKGKELGYLPDHLFSEALLLNSERRTSKKTAGIEDIHDASHPKSSKRRKRAARSKKDIVLGSKTIRVLAEKRVDPVLNSVSRTIPPGKIRRFADKRLLLKPDKRNNSWQRKPANIGSLRNRHLPATNFVRNRDYV